MVQNIGRGPFWRRGWRSTRDSIDTRGKGGSAPGSQTARGKSVATERSHRPCPSPQSWPPVRGSPPRSDQDVSPVSLGHSIPLARWRAPSGKRGAREHELRSVLPSNDRHHIRPASLCGRSGETPLRRLFQRHSSSPRRQPRSNEPSTGRISSGLKNSFDPRIPPCDPELSTGPPSTVSS